MRRRNARQAGRQAGWLAMRATTSPIAQALAQLQLERDNLSARLAKVDALIVSMRDVFHLPNRPTLVNRPAREAPAHTNGRGKVSSEAIRAALREGPMSPGALADRLGIPRPRLRYTLAQLEADGDVLVTGVTASRRVALPGRAKEVP